MNSTSEKGHAKNVALFEGMIAFCNGYGASYNPTNERLSITSLNEKLEKARIKVRNVKDAKQPFDAAVGARQLVFQPLKPYTTRIINALAAQGAPDTTIKDARTIVRKIFGKRADNKTPESPEQILISVSQQSYDRLIDHFEQLLVLAQGETSYSPNEEDLKIPAIESFLSSINAANARVRNTVVGYSNAIIARDKELYDLETGMVEIAFEVKNYVKSVFGAASAEYRQISGFEFTRPK